MTRSEYKEELKQIFRKAIEENNQKEVYAWLGINNLFFLLTVLLGRKDADNDFVIFEGEELFRILLRTGDILVLYPEDVHMPGLKIEKSNFNKKAVFKVELSKM